MRLQCRCQEVQIIGLPGAVGQRDAASGAGIRDGFGAWRSQHADLAVELQRGPVRLHAAARHHLRWQLQQHRGRTGSRQRRQRGVPEVVLRERQLTARLVRKHGYQRLGQGLRHDGARLRQRLAGGAVGGRDRSQGRWRQGCIERCHKHPGPGVEVDIGNRLSLLAGRQRHGRIADHRDAAAEQAVAERRQRISDGRPRAGGNLRALAATQADGPQGWRCRLATHRVPRQPDAAASAIVAIETGFEAAGKLLQAGIGGDRHGGQLIRTGHGQLRTDVKQIVIARGQVGRRDGKRERMGKRRRWPDQAGKLSAGLDGKRQQGGLDRLAVANGAAVGRQHRLRDAHADLRIGQLDNDSTVGRQRSQVAWHRSSIGQGGFASHL